MNAIAPCNQVHSLAGPPRSSRGFAQGSNNSLVQVSRVLVQYLSTGSLSSGSFCAAFCLQRVLSEARVPVHELISQHSTVVCLTGKRYTLRAPPNEIVLRASNTGNPGSPEINLCTTATTKMIAALKAQKWTKRSHAPS